MQTYNNLYEITVNSTNHGKRIFMVAARSPEDVCKAMNIQVSAWLDDEDLIITSKRPSADIFIVVTDAAYGQD